jgi:hypothetical protein
VRTDSAHDAVDNRVELSRRGDVDYIIKWNPRKQDPEAWRALAFSKGNVESPRPGKRVVVFSIDGQGLWSAMPKNRRVQP